MRVLCVTHSCVFPAGWEDGHRAGPCGEQNTHGQCVFTDVTTAEETAV